MAFRRRWPDTVKQADGSDRFPTIPLFARPLWRGSVEDLAKAEEARRWMAVFPIAERQRRELEGRPLLEVVK